MTNKQVYETIVTRTQAEFTAQRLRLEAVYSDFLQYIEAGGLESEHSAGAAMLLLELEYLAHGMSETLHTLAAVAATVE